MREIGGRERDMSCEKSKSSLAWNSSLLYSGSILEKFARLELKFTKLKFHLGKLLTGWNLNLINSSSTWFFFFFNSTSDLYWLDLERSKVDFGLELEFAKLEF